MSEQFPQNLEEQFFELDRALTDPLMQKTLSKARYWNELLKSGEVMQDSFGDIIADLDAEWEPFLKEKVLITGSIVYVVEDEPAVLDVREQEVISNGFSFLPAIISKDGQILSGKGHPEIRHHLYVPTSIIPDLAIDEEFIAVFSDLDIYMEPQTSSVERAESWLITSFPEFKEELDEVRVQSGRDEIKFLIGLKELTLPDKFDGSDVIALECMKTYVNNLIDFDHNVPYVITIQQFLDTEDPHASLLERLQIDVRLVGIHGLSIGREGGGAPINQWTFGIDGGVHGPRKNLQPQFAFIPLPNIMDVLAVRREYMQDDSVDS